MRGITMGSPQISSPELQRLKEQNTLTPQQLMEQQKRLQQQQQQQQTGVKHSDKQLKEQ
eukprot:Pgem_evm1s15114